LIAYPGGLRIFLSLQRAFAAERMEEGRARAPGSRLDRILLDASVLFSAAYLEHSGVVRLWHLEDSELLSSA